MSIDRREVVEIIRPIASGITEPYLCMGDDEQLYCVKGRSILTRGKIAEAICAVAGRAIGLPVPEFCISEFSPGLARLSEEIPAVRKIGLDPAFASKWVQPADTLSIIMQSRYPKSLLAKLFLFDQWIMNGDRTLTEQGGNVNLLVDLTNYSLVVIDHNLAFSGTVTRDEAVLHVGYPAWHALRTHGGFVDQVKLEMRAACDQLVNVADTLPIEWLEQEPDFVDIALDALGRAASAVFWDGLP